MSSKAIKFLEKYGMSPELICPERDAVIMAQEMERGLAGEESSLPMIPTYLKDEGLLPENTPVAVIDAGGTNFRSALVSFTGGKYQVEHLSKKKMPGIDKPADWQEFIYFVADNIMPLMDKTDRIGFCFSYSADITPQIDGRVICIDKEVVINNSSGKLVGASLIAELERRGVHGKKAVIVNDTAAVLLGGASASDRESCGSFIGQVSGTGTNTCCALPLRRIGKLKMLGERRIIINTESGMYDKMPRGRFDEILDRESNNPGKKWFEKQTAGVYLGELCRLMLFAAADEGLLSGETAAGLSSLGRIDSAVVDAWSCGEELDELCLSEDDRDFVKTLCLALFERSARCMCTNLLALMLLTEAGTEENGPVCICAEGSLVQKGRMYRPMLEKLLEENAGEKLSRRYIFKVGQETTLPGSAAAALLNA